MQSQRVLTLTLRDWRPDGDERERPSPDEINCYGALGRIR
jgi:hypothetical protein